MKRRIVIICTLLLVACQRNDAPTDNSDPREEAILYYTEILNEYVLANEIFQDVVNNIGDALIIAEGSVPGKTNNTKADPAITIAPLDLETFPKTITVDYGSGILCEDGINRRGVISIQSTGWYGQMGSVHTLTFNNYYHDIFKVEGIQVVENFGENEEGHIVFGATVEDGIVTIPGGRNITFNDDSTSTWIGGSDTPLNIWDLQIGNVSDIEINYNNQTITILGETISWN